METDVAAFARQLKQDGIDAARTEASGILDEARTRAAEIVRQAQAAAGKVLRDAEAEIESQRQRQAVEIRLVARDAMLKVKEEIERVALLLLRQPIAEALAADEVVRAAIVELVQNSASGQEWEIRVGPRIGKALVQATVNDLFKGREAAAILIEEFRRSGLEFRSGAGEVLELSEESVTDLFRRLMSPELSRLLDSRPG
jgi:vacuolar-type H+-ATPase subunit H